MRHLLASFCKPPTPETSSQGPNRPILTSSKKMIGSLFTILVLLEQISAMWTPTIKIPSNKLVVGSSNTTTIKSYVDLNDCVCNTRWASCDIGCACDPNCNGGSSKSAGRFVSLADQLKCNYTLGAAGLLNKLNSTLPFSSVFCIRHNNINASRYYSIPDQPVKGTGSYASIQNWTLSVTVATSSSRRRLSGDLDRSSTEELAEVDPDLPVGPTSTVVDTAPQDQRRTLAIDYKSIKFSPGTPFSKMNVGISWFVSQESDTFCGFSNSGSFLTDSDANLRDCVSVSKTDCTTNTYQIDTASILSRVRTAFGFSASDENVKILFILINSANSEKISVNTTQASVFTRSADTSTCTITNIPTSVRYIFNVLRDRSAGAYTITSLHVVMTLADFTM